MGLPFALAVGQVNEVTISYVAMDQLFQCRFDVLLTGAAAALDTIDLRNAIAVPWTTWSDMWMADSANFAQFRVQRITDVIMSGGRPTRVRGALYTDHTAGIFPQGDIVPPHLPLDVTLSLSLQTAGPPRSSWGHKSHGPLGEGITDDDGESIVPATFTALQAGANDFWASSHVIAASGMSWAAVVIPATAIANLALPHPALSTLVNDIEYAQVGRFVGSQRTRAITPNSLRGH